MDLGEVNFFAVLLAAIASFLFGGVWYGMFARQWLSAVERDNERRGGTTWPVRASAIPLIIAFLAQLLMAYILAGVIGNLGPGEVTPINGVVSGVYVWIGFVMTVLVVSHAFQGTDRALTLIDGGHWLGVLMIQGAVIGWIGT